MRIRLVFLFISFFLFLVNPAICKNSIEVVVHRGANALAPENTIASADSALAHGAKWIEVDVRPSKDQVLFNLHDETLDRTTDGKGRLVDMLAKDVCKLDAGAWFSHKYVGVPVPTIADMLDYLRGKAKVFFDVKRGTSVSQLVKLVREKGFAKNSFFWFGDENMLREFIRIAPDMKVKVNAANVERLKYWQSFCKPAYVEIAPQNITRQFIEYCHRHGILVMAACQEDDTSQFQMCIDKNADLVNLDRPEIFQRVQKRLDLKTILLKIPADGKTLCTTQLQQAIDRIAKRGWGTLVLTPGTYLSGSIFLKSGVTLKLEKGAVLLGSPNPYQYMKADVNANGQDARNDNVSIEQVKKYPEFSMFGELPAYGFYLRHIENVIFKNVKMKLKESDYRPAIVMDDVENVVMNEVYPNSIFKRKL